jgi:hypothetical protein
MSKGAGRAARPAAEVLDEAAPAIEAPASSELEAIAAASSVASPEAPPLAGLVEGALAIARIVEIDHDGVTLDVGGRRARAAVDPTVHRAVLETARERSEMVLVTRGASGLSVVGALRTQPTAGIEPVDELTLKARRISIDADEEIQIRSGAAIIAVRAVGEVETYADRIISRAEELQKIVARMLRLN